MGKIELLVNVITYVKENDFKIDVQTKDNVSRIVLDEKQKILILS